MDLPAKKESSYNVRKQIDQYKFRSNRMFSRFFIPFKDPCGIDTAILGKDISKAIGRYQHGLELYKPVHEWFSQPVPGNTIAADMIARSLAVTR